MTTRKRSLALVSLLVTAVTVGVLANSGSQGRGDDWRDYDDRDGSYGIGLWGDLPYSDVQDTGVENLIKDMNAQALAFTVHDGDLKQGNGLPFCDDALYTKALGYFNSLKAPAMFTPGDNDWTDCDRPNNGSFDSLDRLSLERRLFFSDRVLARAAPAPPAGADRSAVPGGLQREPILRGLRREPPLDGRPGHVRDDEHPGQLQQSVWCRLQRD